MKYELIIPCDNCWNPFPHPSTQKFRDKIEWHGCEVVTWSKELLSPWIYWVGFKGPVDKCEHELVEKSLRDVTGGAIDVPCTEV